MRGGAEHKGTSVRARFLTFARARMTSGRFVEAQGTWGVHMPKLPHMLHNHPGSPATFNIMG